MIRMETKANLIIFVKLLVSKRLLSMKFKKNLGNFRKFSRFTYKSLKSFSNDFLDFDVV